MLQMIYALLSLSLFYLVVGGLTKRRFCHELGAINCRTLYDVIVTSYRVGGRSDGPTHENGWRRCWKRTLWYKQYVDESSKRKSLSSSVIAFQLPTSTMPSYTLQTPQGSFRAFAPLIAAEFNGIDVKVADFDASASPTGKAPILLLPNSATPLFSSHAIARFLGGLRRDTGLLGQSLQDTAAIDAWMDFASHELELPACVWFYPVRTDMMMMMYDLWWYMSAHLYILSIIGRRIHALQ